MPTIPGRSGRGGGTRVSDGNTRVGFTGEPRGLEAAPGGSAETGVKRSCASLQRKNPKNTRTRSGTGAGAARAVAVRTDFLGALSHLVRVCGNVEVDEGVRGTRGVLYRPSPGDGKPRIDLTLSPGCEKTRAGCLGHAARATRESSRGRARGRDTRVLVASGRSLTCTDADVRLKEGALTRVAPGFMPRRTPRNADTRFSGETREVVE